MTPPDPHFASRVRDSVTRGEVYADDGRHVATMLQTLMALPNTPDRPE